MQPRVNEGARHKSIASRQHSFLLSIWRRHTLGFVFLGARNASTGHWHEEGFDVDLEWPGIRDFLEEFEPSSFDQYFCPNAFDLRRRMALYALPTPFAWCDIDAGDPKLFVPPPSVLILTSPGRTQGIWEFDNWIPAPKAEAVSKHLAYSYKGDRNGWSSTKFLRLPYGFNHKPQYRCPKIALVKQPRLVRSEWPKPLYAGPSMRVPTETFNPKYDPALVAKRYRREVGGDRYRLMTDAFVISSDRSRCVFMIAASLLDAGASADEIASVIWHSPYFVSKYGQSRTKLNEELSRILGKLRGGR